MTHEKIYENCLTTLLLSDAEIECWFPNCKNSVRVRTKHFGDFIFTYQNKKYWKAESVDSWLDGIKVKVEE